MSNVTGSAALGHLGAPGGLGAWFRTTDHRRISLMFLAWTAGAFLVAMIMGVVPLAKTLEAPGLESKQLFANLTYQRLLQVVAWLVPVLPAVIGFFVLPGQLGVRDMALPALSRCSLRFWVVGLVLMLASLFVSPVAAGWTLDSHLSLLDPGAFGLLLAGLFFMGLSWFVTGVNFIVTVHQSRRGGSGFGDMPLTAWGFYLHAYLLVVSGVVFCVIVLYLAGARITTKGLFGWQADPMIWRSYFWFALRPVVFFAVLPGVGVVSDVIDGIARRPSAGHRTLVGSMIALTGIAVVSYGAAMIGQGLSPAGSLVFSFLSLLAAVPVALIAVTWLATLHRGSVTWGAPASFVLGFMLFAGAAAAQGLVLASPTLGSFLGATMFVSAQLDYLIWGAVTCALLAGLHYWWPRMMGRRYTDGVAHVGAVLLAVGLNLALVPRIVLGTRGVPQDMAGIVDGPLGLSELAGLGWLVVYAALAAIAINLLATVFTGDAAEENPWGAVTPEWSPSPPPADDPA